MTRSVAVFAGEKSGDMYGGFLINMLKQTKNLHVSGMGGSHMKSAGCEIRWDISDYAVMGFSEVISHLPRFFRLFSKIKSFLQNERPDFIVCIDNWGLNRKIAEFACSQGIRVYYFICPKFWAWGKNRARKVCEISDRVYVIFPFEYDALKQYTDNVFYFGHPLVDVMAESSRTTPEKIREKLLDQKKYLVAVMPGSRKSEITALAGPLSRICRSLSELCSIRFAVIQSDTVSEHKGFREFRELEECVIIDDADRYSIMAASDFVLAASGTVTLETMILSTPMAVFYKITTISYYIARVLLKIKNVSLPNIIAGKRIVPEKIQYFNETDTAQSICEILCDAEKTARMRRALKKHADKLGTPGIIQKIAGHMLEEL